MPSFDLRVTLPNSMKRLAEMFPKASLRALNKVGRSAEVRANRQIRKVYNVSRSEVDAGINVRAASVSKLTYSIFFKGKQTPIIDFIRDATVTRALDKERNRLHALPVTIKRGSRKTVKHWFIQRMPNTGHVGVFMRAGASRLPIKQKFTISIGQMFKGIKVFSEVHAYINQEFPRVLQHEIEWFVKNLMK